MKDYDPAHNDYDPTHRDYQIRDKHYLEQELTILKLRKDLKKKLRILYLTGFIIFVVTIISCYFF